ncbi:hypothetical protein IDJ77_26845 [Mucilaginibacter sp. ZT4R22]|uniref:DUF4221 domain-containing protein n=1 Tax=Mucilaginibacter pankratovii TaxID=2772110 RepID=A0ABR7WZ52_9SPHI|nr:hypothetical protein [Mucilaginibacter pankratovii]MBD1367458.1 hypothetical protein [Mucilaginibacter pankratovii]
MPNKNWFNLPAGLVAFILIYFVSCNVENNSFKLTPTGYSNSGFKIDTSTLIIDADTPKVFTYKIFSVDKDGTFAGYNEYDHKVHLYSLDHKKAFSKFSLIPKSLSGTLPFITGLYLQNRDSIFVLSRTEIGLYDYKGNLKETFVINAVDDYFKANYLMDFSEALSFEFDSNSKKLLVPTINPLATNVNHFNYSFITEIDTRLRRSFKRLPIQWSELYKNGYYGFMIDPQYSISNINGHNSILYNFVVEPNVYVLDLKTGKVSIHGGKPSSKLPYSEVANPIDGKWAHYDDKKIVHFLENVRYFKILKIKGGYIRAFEEPVKYSKKSNGQFPDFKDKRRFITVFDETFKVLGNIDLNDKWYFLGRSFVVNNSIFVPYPSKKDFRFKQIKITYIKN